jgi:hypothetical protein
MNKTVKTIHCWLFKFCIKAIGIHSLEDLLYERLGECSHIRVSKQRLIERIFIQEQGKLTVEHKMAGVDFFWGIS